MCARIASSSTGQSAPARKHSLYRLKPTNRGKFVVPPLYAEGMYNRAVQARSLGGQFVVDNIQAPVEMTMHASKRRGLHPCGHRVRGISDRRRRTAVELSGLRTRSRCWSTRRVSRKRFTIVRGICCA